MSDAPCVGNPAAPPGIAQSAGRLVPPSGLPAVQRLVAGAVESTRTVTPVGTTSRTGGTVASGTSHTYRLSAYRGTWTCGQVTTSTTPAR